MSQMNGNFYCGRYRGRDKGMPNGWSFNWEREGLETRCLGSLLVVYLSLCLMDAKRRVLCPQGANDQLAHHNISAES
jgi:hypothetical protein